MAKIYSRKGMAKIYSRKGIWYGTADDMIARIEALEARAKAADALATYIERDCKTLAASSAHEWERVFPYAAEILRAYQATKEQDG